MKAESNIAAHTPVPWSVDSCMVFPSEQHQRKAPIARTDLSHGIGNAAITDKANAAFIVRACNSHEELIDCLEDFLSWGPAVCECGHPACKPCKYTTAARTALAKAKGNP